MNRRVPAPLVLACSLLAALGCSARVARTGSQGGPARYNSLLFVQSDTAGGPADRGWRLALMNEKGEERRPLEGTEHGIPIGWSPTGESFAYSVDEGVHLYYPSTGRRLALNVGKRVLGALSWFPERERIAFDWGRRSRRGYPTEAGLSVIDIESGQINDLLVRREVITVPVVSPNGRQVAFGDDTRGLASVDFGRRGGPIRLLAPLDGQQRVTGISWSPDGQFVLFKQSTILPSPIRECLHVCDLGTGRVWELAKAEEGVTISGLIWHPNSGKAAFALVDFGRHHSGLYFAKHSKAAWEVSSVVLPSGFLSGLAGWSPDGRLFSYSLFRGDSGRVFVCDDEGLHPRPISPEDSMDSMPQWRPGSAQGSAK